MLLVQNQTKKQEAIKSLIVNMTILNDFALKFERKTIYYFCYLKTWDKTMSINNIFI